MAKDVNETFEYDWPEVEVMGHMLSNEAQAVLSSEITILKGPHRETPAKDWQLVTTNIVSLIEHCLSKHPVVSEKDGEAFVYARGRKCGTIKRGGKETCKGQRAQNKIEEITAIFIDVDGDDKARRVAERLRELGYFAIIYTTHSHHEKKTEIGDRFRIIVFLEEPIPFPRGMEERRAAVQEYRARYTGFCELLGLTEIDSSGMNLHQMMYTPRRASDDAEYEHYVIAGRALLYKEMPKGDPSKYLKAKNTPNGRRLSDKGTASPAYLSDGFNLKQWYADGGRNILINDILDVIGWDVRGSGSSGWTEIQCPNHAQHSDPDQDTCGIIENDEDGTFGSNCFHDHCAPLSTFDMLVLIEKAIIAGEVALPDEYERFSELLCDLRFYPDDVFEGCPEDFGGHKVIKSLRTADAVEKAFEAVLADEDAGETDYIRIYAGVAKGGEKTKAREALVAGMAKVASFNGNDRNRFQKLGRELVDAEREREAETDRRQAVDDAGPDTDGVNTSMDPAAPLGDTLKTSLATLRRRYAVVDANGKFRVVRLPDLSAMGSEHDSTVIYYLKTDFLDLHMDRYVKTKKGNIEYPAEVFLETEPRKSAIVFAPHPVKIPETALNTYLGRKLQSTDGDWPTIRKFIFHVICDSDEAKYAWLILWMAHMVQRPGEKPGTAVVAHGLGGIGKGTFGRILMKLTLPNGMLLEKEAHVMGQFAGEHLSQCILACVTEAIFGKSPKVAAELKGMVDSPTVSVEAKGMSVYTALSYLRLYFDGNDDVIIRIEGNGSERRYFVLKVSDVRKGKKDYFKKLNAAIEGDEMAAFLGYLEGYDPASAGFEWVDVRTAPWTAERDVMMVHSMSAPMRRFKEVIEDGEVTLRGHDGARETYLANNGKLRVPQSFFRAYIAEVGNDRNSDGSDIPAMYAVLRPEGKIEKSQGKVGNHDNLRWFEFNVTGG